MRAVEKDRQRQRGVDFPGWRRRGLRPRSCASQRRPSPVWKTRGETKGESRIKTGHKGSRPSQAAGGAEETGYPFP
jgi:hypothetical protein